MKSSDKIRVLLLDGHTVQAYSTIKALHNTGIYVTVFCEKRISYGYASRFADARIKCPALKNNSGVFWNFLRSYLEKHPHHVLIPLFDESADFVNTNRKALEALGIKVALADKKRYELVRNKASMMAFCKKNKIPHPASVKLSADNLEKAAAKLGFPSLIKPVVSSGALGIVYLNSLNDLVKNFAETSKRYGDAMLQTFINHSGYYYNAMLFRNHENVFSTTIILKINRYFPTKGGTGSYSETVEHKEIEKLCKETLERLNWTGFADIDFMVDKDTQVPNLIEINPRIPACIHAALVSGINFPQIIVYDALGKQMPEQQFIAHKKIRFMAMDVLWFLYNKNRLKARPGWFNFFGKNLYYQDGSWNDPLTMIAGMIMGFKKYLNASFRHAKLTNT